MSYDSSGIIKLGHLKSAIEEAQAFTAEVASAAAAAIEELVPTSISMTIPTTGWSQDNTAVYSYYYDYAVQGITADNRAEVTLAVSSLQAAAACGICPTNETIAGYIRLRAMSVPTASITAVALIS